MRLLGVVEREGVLCLGRFVALLQSTLEPLHALSIYKGRRKRYRGATVREGCTNKDNGKPFTLEYNYEAFENAVRVRVILRGLPSVARGVVMKYVQCF